MWMIKNIVIVLAFFHYPLCSDGNNCKCLIYIDSTLVSTVPGQECDIFSCAVLPGCWDQDKCTPELSGCGGTYCCPTCTSDHIENGWCYDEIWDQDHWACGTDDGPRKCLNSTLLWAREKNRYACESFGGCFNGCTYWDTVVLQYYYDKMEGNGLGCSFFEECEE